MKFKEIEILLEKYYEGTSTVNEERKLKEFFAQDDIPVHLKEHKALFVFHADEAKQELDNPLFDQILADKIKGGKIISISTRRRTILYITSIAASLLILFGIAYTFQNDIFRNHQAENEAGTITDPVIAYKEASKALMMLSANFNTGLEHVQKLHSFSTGMEKMQNFTEYDRIQSSIINPDAFR